MRLPLTKKDLSRARHLKRKAVNKLDNLDDIRKIPKFFERHKKGLANFRLEQEQKFK